MGDLPQEAIVDSPRLIDPRTKGTNRKRRRNRLQADDADAAGQALERSPDVGHDDEIAQVLRQAGRLADAEAEARRATELASDNAEYHATLARVLRQVGRLADAEAEARRAIELAPDNADYHDTLALVFGRRVGWRMPRRRHAERWSWTRTTPVTDSRWRSSSEQAGRLADAEAEARRASELAPDNASHRETLALASSGGRAGWRMLRLRHGARPSWPRTSQLP